MHFNAAVVAALLPAMGLAIGFLRSTDVQTAGLEDSKVTSKNGPNAGSGEKGNTCGVSDFRKLDGFYPALVADCEQLISNIPLNTVWNVADEWEKSGIPTFGTCTFQARVTEDPLIHGYIGDDDVKDLMRDAIAMYSHGVYIAAQGGYDMYTKEGKGMPCDSPDLREGLQVAMQWRLRST